MTSTAPELLSEQTRKKNLLTVIQGGMGVAVSGWKLARAVSLRGQLGVVSGTALDTVLVHRLQLGDPEGNLKAAFDHFPVPSIAKRVWDQYYIPGGKPVDAAYKSKPIPKVVPSQALVDLIVLANFVEIWLAKQGHGGMVGLNLLEKIQLPTLPSLYGAMLAGVDAVLMGAGIPRAIPGLLEQLSRGEACELRIDVAGGDSVVNRFDPAPYGGSTTKRPKFYAIVSSASLGQVLARKCTPPVDGFVIEGHTAGGHNAPPRGTLQLNENGKPMYGERDLPDLAKFRDLGLSFWLAGSFGSREKLREAWVEGAQGIQVGTAFAFCEESGIAPDLKAEIIRLCQLGDVRVMTDPKASPTGFPIKVLNLPGTVSDSEVAESRERVCDLGHLREVYQTPSGGYGYRCPGEPISDYVAKGGNPEDTVGRKCVCNGLLATVGLGQIRKRGAEPALITVGDDLPKIVGFLRPGRNTYSAGDVLDTILAESV
jgi:nitronate monooxygenase